MSLCDIETCKYPLARFMYYCIRLHCDVTGEHKSLYALYADSTFIARLNTADCVISRYAAAMSSALLSPAVWRIRLFRSLQVKFNYIAAKLARKGKNIYAYGIWFQKPEGYHSEDVGVDGTIILKLILNKLDGRMRARLI